MLVNYENFHRKFFAKTKCSEGTDTILEHKLLNEISNVLGGTSFNGGIFVVYTPKEVPKYTMMLEEAFPDAKGKITCFGRDWINRQFAVFKGEPATVLLFDINFDEVLDLEMDMNTFFEHGLIEYTNDILAEDFFDEWKKSNINLDCKQCVGYKVLPILGGEDEIGNLEVVDSDWSFEMNTLLVQQVIFLDECEKILNVQIL